MYIKGNKRLELWVIFLHTVKRGDKHLLDGANHAPYLSHEKQRLHTYHLTEDVNVVIGTTPESQL